MRRIQTIWMAVMILLVISCLSGCGKEEKEITAEELLGGIHLGMENPMKVSMQAEVSGEMKNVSGAAVSIPMGDSMDITVSAHLENTGKTAHVTGNGSMNGMSSDFEWYLTDTGAGYDCYIRMGQDEWTHSKAGKSGPLIPPADAGMLEDAKVKTTEAGYEVTGQIKLSDMVKTGQTVSSGPSISGSVSAYGVDATKLAMNARASFNKDKQLTSITVEAGDSMKEELRRLSGGEWNMKITADFDWSDGIQVQIPGEVQNQASAGAALEDEDLLQANNIQAETSEEFADLLGLKYKDLEDEEKLLVSNMLYYLGGNERVKEACKGWGALPESDKKALAAIVKHQYVSPDTLVMFGANESELNTLAEGSLP